MEYLVLNTQTSDLIPKSKRPLQLLDEEIPRYKFTFDSRDVQVVSRLPRRSFRDVTFVMDTPFDKNTYEALDYSVKSAEADFNGFETAIFDGSKVIGKLPDQSVPEYNQHLAVQINEEAFYHRDPEEKIKVFQVPWVVKHAVLRPFVNKQRTEKSTQPVTCSDLDAVDYFEPKELVLFLIECLPVVCQACSDLEAAQDQTRTREANKLYKLINENIEAQLRRGSPLTLSISLIRDFLETYLLFDSIKASNAVDVAKTKRSEVLTHLAKAAAFYRVSSPSLSLLTHLAENAHSLQKAANSKAEKSVAVDYLILGIECMKRLVEYHSWLSFQYQRTRSTLTYADLERYRTKERLFDVAYMPKPSPKWPDSQTIPGTTGSVKVWSKALPVPLSTIDLISIVRMFDTQFIRFLFHDYDDAAYYQPISRSLNGRIQECAAVASVVQSLDIGGVQKRHLDNMKKLRCKIGIALHEQNSDTMILKSLSKQTGHPQMNAVDPSQLSPAYQVRRMFTLWQMFTRSDLKQSADADDTLLTENTIKLDFIAEPRFKNIENRYEKQGTLESILDGMNNVNDIVHRRLLFEAIYSVQGSLLDYDQDIAHDFIKAHNEKIRLLQEAALKRTASGRAQYMTFVKDRSFSDHDDRKEMLADVFYKPFDFQPAPLSGRDTRLPPVDSPQMTSDRLEFLKRMPKHHVFFVPLTKLEVPNTRSRVTDEYPYLVKNPDCSQNTLLGQDKNLVVVIIDVCHNKLLVFDPAYASTDRTEVLRKVFVTLLSMGLRFRRKDYLNHTSYAHTKLDYTSAAFHKPAETYSEVSRTKQFSNLAAVAEQIIEDYKKSGVLEINTQPALRGTNLINLEPVINTGDSRQIGPEDRIALGISDRTSTAANKARGQQNNRGRGQGQGQGQGRGRGRGRNQRRGRNGGSLSQRGGGLARVESTDRNNQSRDLRQWQVTGLQVLPHIAIWYVINYLYVKAAIPDVVSPQSSVGAWPSSYRSSQLTSPYDQKSPSESNALLPDGFIEQMYKSTTFDTNPSLVFQKNIDKLFENLFNNFFRSPHRPGGDTGGQKNQGKGKGNGRGRGN